MRPNLNNNIFNKLEEIKIFLENKIGDDKILQCY